MVNKCACNSTRCSCEFADSISVKVTGNGSPEEPFAPDVVLPLLVSDTATLDLELEDGTLRAFPIGTVSPDVQMFTADGTWNKPPGVTSVRILVIGGGGGGGGGATTHAYLSSNKPAGGGAGGNVTALTLAASDLAASESVIVGAGGAGGVPGVAGAAGGESRFGIYRASGGGGGGAGNTGVTAVSGAIGTAISAGQDGGGTVRSTPFVYAAVPTGGGRGHYNHPSVDDSATRGAVSHPNAGARWPVVSTTYDSLGNGSDELVTKMGWGGPGNPGPGTRNMDAGGHGGLYGGGGGGGSQASDLYPASPGGDGAPGIVVVMAW